MMRSLRRLLPALLLLAAVVAGGEEGERPVAMTTAGRIRGRVIPLPDGRTVDAFLGVPYAEAPVGERRFQGPLAKGPWAGVRDAGSFGPLCPQSRNRSHWDVVADGRGRRVLRRLGLWDYAQGEDCLHLNLYAPSFPTEANQSEAGLPVMVFFHGGSYKTNGGRFYPGEWLAAAGRVVVVTLNYRLGVLGFLSTEDDAARGNYGLHDQLLALQWVKQNAGVFGGDPQLVTIFGNSAGGACVGLHLLSPLARGLFQRAILQSGSPIGEWAVQRRPRMYVERLSRKLGCPDWSTSAAILECLRGLDAQTIVDKSEDASLEDSLMLQFAPSVDGLLLPDHPAALLRREGALGSPAPPQTMVGVTRDELEVWMTKSYQDRDPASITFTRELLRRYLAHLLRREPASGAAAADVLLHAVYTEYVYEHEPRRRRQQNGTARAEAAVLPDIRTLGKIISDIDLKAPSVRLVELLSLHPGTSVYLYEFDYASSDDVIAAKYVGSYHESELYYVFGFPHLGLDNALRLPQDRAVADTLARLWTDFARTGDPTPGNGSSGFRWRPHSPDDDCFASLGLQPFVARSYEARRMAFWNHFVPLFTEYPMAPAANASANNSANSSSSTAGLLAGLSCERPELLLGLLALLLAGSLLFCCSATALLCCRRCREGEKRAGLEEGPAPV